MPANRRGAGGGRHFHRRRRARAPPAPPRTVDGAPVGRDFDLDDGGGLGAVRRVGLPATGADARTGRRVADFGPLPERGPRGAAMALGAGLTTAPALRTRPLLTLAPATEQPPRQYRSGGAKLREFGLQPRTAGLRLAKLPAKPPVLPRQRPERRLLAPRPPQGLAKRLVRTRRPRARRLLRAQQPLLQPFLHSSCGPERAPQIVAQLTQLPAEPDDLLVPTLNGLLVGLPLQLLPGQPILQPGDILLPPLNLLAKRLYRLLPLLHDSVQPRGLLRRQSARESLVQPGHLLAKRLKRAALPRLDTGFAKKLLLSSHFRLERLDVLLRRAADFLQLPDARGKLHPAVVEMPLQRTRPRERSHLLEPQPLAARLRRLRARTLALVQRTPVRLCGCGQPGRMRTWGIRPLDQRNFRLNIFCAYRHADMISTCRISLPVAREDSIRWRRCARHRVHHGLDKRLHRSIRSSGP